MKPVPWKGASRAWNKTGSFYLISCPQVPCPQAKPHFLNPKVPEDDEGPRCPSSSCTAPPWLGFLLSLRAPSTLCLVGPHLMGEHASWGWSRRRCEGRRCGPGVDSSVRKRKRKTGLYIFGSLRFRPKSVPRWGQHQTSQSGFENAGCLSDPWEL